MKLADLAQRLDVVPETVRRAAAATGLRHIGTHARWAPFTAPECMTIDVYVTARQMYTDQAVALVLAGAVLAALTDGDGAHWLTYDVERGIVRERGRRAVVAAIAERDLTIIDLDALADRWRVR